MYGHICWCNDSLLYYDFLTEGSTSAWSRVSLSHATLQYIYYAHIKDARLLRGKTVAEGASEQRSLSLELAPMKVMRTTSMLTTSLIIIIIITKGKSYCSLYNALQKAYSKSMAHLWVLSCLIICSKFLGTVDESFLLPPILPCCNWCKMWYPSRNFSLPFFFLKDMKEVIFS